LSNKSNMDEPMSPAASRASSCSRASLQYSKVPSDAVTATPPPTRSNSNQDDPAAVSLPTAFIASQPSRPTSELHYPGRRVYQTSITWKELRSGTRGPTMRESPQGGSRRQIMRPVERSAFFVAVLALAACGGGGNADSGAAGAPARGSLLQSPPQLLSTVTAPTLLLELNAATNQQLLSLSGNPVCDILMYDIRYETVGGAGEPTTASAALMIPTGLGAGCTGPRPTVLYAHGTTTDRAFSMANMQNTETLFLAALFASNGYIVVA